MPIKTPEQEYIPRADASIRQMALSGRNLPQGSAPAWLPGKRCGLDVWIKMARPITGYPAVR
jgi:hypothetical protein